ncbi:hypothetical protein L916_09164, partial [Phytophthora nicotianae]
MSRARYMAILNIFSKSKSTNDDTEQHWKAPLSHARNIAHIEELVRCLCAEIGFVQHETIASHDDDMIRLRSAPVGEIGPTHADAYEASPRVVMPHYAQLTLGIEKDHLSDEDFTPGDEGAVLDDHKALKQESKARINKRKEGRLGKLDDLREHAKLRKVETGEKVENVETDGKMENVDNDEEVDSDKKVESAESGEIVESVEASKNVESGHSVEESECGEKRDREVEKQASKSKVESVKSAENVENTDTVESVGSTEYLEGVDTMANSEGYFDGYKPRKRASQHIAEHDTMAVQQEKIVNIVAPFPKVPIKSWTEFDTILASFTKSHNPHSRVRSSEATNNRW